MKKTSHNSGKSIIGSDQSMDTDAGDSTSNDKVLRFVLDAAEIGYWDWNAQTRKVKWERQHNLMIGLPPEQTEGTFEQFIACVYTEDRESVTEKFEQSVREGKDFQAEFRVVHPDGSFHWISGRGRLYGDNESRMIGIVRNVTEHKRREATLVALLERERAASAAAFTANRAKDEFLAAVSHELRAPLTSTIGWTGMIRSGKLDAENLEQALSTIERNARAQQHLIDSLASIADSFDESSANGKKNLSANETVKSSANNDAKLHKLNVLIVEDDAATRELFEFVLTQCGARVRAVGSAREALSALEERQPDALVCDIGMSEMDGYELIRRVRALPSEKGGAIPAVAVTAYARHEDRARALSEGFQMHIAKPISPEGLAAAVTTLVSGHGLPPPKNTNGEARIIGAETQAKDSSELKKNLAQNLLLAALSAEELERLLPHVEIVALDVNDILCQPDDAIRHVYFPLSAIVSLLAITEDGASVEVGMVGREGMLGVPVVLGFNQMPSWAMTTIAGDAIKISSDVLRREMQRDGGLRDALLDYTRTLITQISQNAVCNRRHSVDDRLCTWLLMMQDRVGKRTLTLTQELIASRLGTRRAGISTSVKTLTDDKIVRTSRGKLRVIGRVKLENAACECYQIIKTEFDNLTKEASKTTSI